MRGSGPSAQGMTAIAPSACSLIMPHQNLHILILNFIIIYSNNFKKNINVNNNNNNNNNNCYYCFSFFFSARSTDPTV
jgi:hypothetical protein